MVNADVQLPHEVLVECFAVVLALSLEPERIKNHAFLLDCALVQRSWRYPAQCQLFREVKFPENITGSQQGIRPYLLNFLDHMKAHADCGSPLPGAVKSLTLTLGVAPSYDHDACVDVDEIGCDLQSLVRLTQLLPNLSHLQLASTLGLFDKDKYLNDPEQAHLVQEVFNVAQLQELRHATQVTALTLSITEYDMPLFWQLLAAFPALECLDIIGSYLISFPSAVLEAPGVDDLSNLATLRELRVTDAEAAAALIARAPLAVQTLHVQQLSSLADIAAFKPSLQCLVVQRFSGNRDDDRSDDEKRFPQLKTLVFGGQHLDETAALLRLVGASPVEHLGLTYAPTGLPVSKELVKRFDDVLGPPGAFASIRSVAVYSSYIPFYLDEHVAPTDELQRFRDERDFAIQAIHDVRLRVSCRAYY